QIGAPGFRPGTGGLRQRLAIIISPGETAKVCAVADAGTGHEKTDVGRLRLGRLGRKNRERCRGRNEAHTRNDFGESGHRILRLSLVDRLIDEPAWSDINTPRQILFPAARCRKDAMPKRKGAAEPTAAP